MGDTRRLAGIDVVVTGCIIKGRHGHDRCRQATGRQAPQRAPPQRGRTRWQSRLNRGSPMLNAQRPTTPQQEPGMAGAEEPPFMGPADPTPASGAGQRFTLDRIAQHLLPDRFGCACRQPREGEEMRRTLYRYRYLVLGIVLAAIVGQITFGYAAATRQVDVSGGGVGDWP